jgi:MOB kinase activator 1
VIDFINGINMLYGSLDECCTATSCPTMNAGPEYEYLWRDKKNPEYKKPKQVPAKQYIDLLMDWVEQTVNDQSIFPSDSDKPFPKDFLKIVKDVFKRLFRVYAHMFCHHLDDITKLGEIAHLNTSFKHFMYFVFEFDLVPPEELCPLREVIVSLLGKSYENRIPQQK